MSDSIWPDDVKEAASKMGGNWLKSEAFEGGLTLKVKKVEKVVSRNPKYGAIESDYLVKNEILEVGQTFHYVFETADGQEKMIDSKSAPFFIGMTNAQIEAEDWVKITRSGERDETRYDVEKVEAPESSKTAPQSDENLDPNQVPF